MRLTFAFFFIPFLSLAQFTYVIDQSIPVTENDATLTMPWGGGLNAAQVNTIDLNNDGIEDLAIFDRTANKIVTYLRENNQYRYAPEYENFFPDDLTSWVLLRDFNCDGKKDIFTRHPLGIKVYLNKTPSTGNLVWEHFLFYSAASGLKLPVLLTKGFSSKGNLQLNTDDMPAIADADGDGDLDIFSPRFPGGDNIEYHKNFSIERYGTCDSLDFERITNTWADVTECGCGSFAIGIDCPTNGRVEHTGGKSISVLDVNGDGVRDVLFSEEFCTIISLLQNDGSNDIPAVSSTSFFPSGNPVSLVNFPSAYYEDLDFDGVKDLLASPNFARHSYENLSAATSESLWFYKNSGTNSQPNFTFQQRNFLQNQMIDVGDNAVPAFFDADGDGDFDLFIGYYSTFFSGSIAYYDNVGTQSSPEFKLITKDLKNLSILYIYNIKPLFVDINGDTKVDLVFSASTAQELFQGRSSIYYMLNSNGIGLNLTEEIHLLNVPDLQLKASENILLRDVDKDGLVDLLVGRFDGSLQYWKNNGTISSPNFSLENDEYLGLAASTSRQNIAPSIADLDNDGTEDLMYGDQTGTLKVIPDFKSSGPFTPIENIVFNEQLNTYSTQNLGGVIWPTVVNLFKTDKPSIIVGNTLGGLQVLKHDGGAALPEQPQIDIYPNPISINGTEKITIKVDRPAGLLIYTALGQELGGPRFFQAFQEYTFKPPFTEKGIYILRFYINGKWYSRRVIIY